MREEEATIFLPPSPLLWGVSVRDCPVGALPVLQPASPHPLSCAGGASTLPSGTVHVGLAFLVGRVNGNVIT